jgi:hypothetical protein
MTDFLGRLIVQREREIDRQCQKAGNVVVHRRHLPLMPPANKKRQKEQLNPVLAGVILCMTNQ